MKTTEKNYQKEAADLLNKFGVKMTANFIGYKKHFSDDKECRDVFNITFKRENYKINPVNIARFSLKFGQSINESDGNGSNKPTAYDVLTCLQKYDVGTFEDFCGEFGYDTDSRKAEKTYKAVCNEYDKISRFFTTEELEQLQEVQ